MGTELTKNAFRFQRLCPAAIQAARNVKGRQTANKMAARNLPRAKKLRMSNAELSPTRTRKFALTRTLKIAKSKKTDVKSGSKAPASTKQSTAQLVRPM